MNNEEAKLKMMDYLCDEMSAEEREAFSKYLENNPGLKKEFKELLETKKLLQTVPDQKKNDRVVVLTVESNNTGDNEHIVPGNRRDAFLTPAVKTVFAVAASVLILLTGAAFTGLQISSTNEGFTISFHNYQALQEPVPAVSDEDLMALAEQIRNENTLLMTTMMDELQVRQRDQLQDAIRVLNTYYEQQREEDLTIIADGMSRLQVETAYKFLQTDETLENIIYALNNQ